MQYFQSLGLLVEERWRKESFNEAEFSSIAMQALAEMPAPENVGVTDILQWVASGRIPPQVDIDANFGEPPVTVFSGPGFRIDVNFWIDGTTAIHQHGFEGAFQVLAGSSVHTEYTFEPGHAMNLRLRAGRLDLKTVDILQVGDTRPIEAGPKFIHALFHLERPSATVVVRSRSNPAAQPQYAYVRPGLAYDPFHREEPLVRKVQVLNTLISIGDAGVDRWLDEAIRSGGPYDAFILLRALALRTLDFSRVEKHLAKLVSAFGAAHETLVAALRREISTKILTDKRKAIHGTEHRWLLAVLLNVPRAPLVLELVGRRSPQRSPVDSVMRWLEELGSMPDASGRGGPNALGLEFGEGTVEVLRWMIEGLDVDAIGAKLREVYPAEEVDEQMPALRAMAAAFRQSPLLEPLLTP